MAIGKELMYATKSMSPQASSIFNDDFNDLKRGLGVRR